METASRRAFLTGSPLAIAGAVSSLTSVPVIVAESQDPVHAAIARHKAAASALDSFLSEVGDLEEWAPEVEHANRRLDAAERRAIFELAATTPTTKEGARASLAHLVRQGEARHYRLLGIFAGKLIAAHFAA